MKYVKNKLSDTYLLYLLTGLYNSVIYIKYSFDEFNFILFVYFHGEMVQQYVQFL